MFVGTRVPVQSLFDYIEGGDTLDEFLRQFPSVRREQAIAALELARESLLTHVRVLLDENLPHDLIDAFFPFGIVVVGALSNRVQDVMSLVPEILAALARVQAGTVEHVGRVRNRRDDLKKP